jgi:hypothetical protein
MSIYKIYFVKKEKYWTSIYKTNIMGMWTNVSRARMLTNPIITRYGDANNLSGGYGGGSKKAGLPNSIGMNTAWDNIFLNRTSQNLIMLVNPTTSSVANPDRLDLDLPQTTPLLTCFRSIF